MANYQALVLQHSETGQVHRVFLIKTEPMQPIPREALLEVQQYAHEKYNQSLTPIDLEAIDIDSLRQRVRTLNRGR